MNFTEKSFLYFRCILIFYFYSLFVVYFIITRSNYYNPENKVEVPNYLDPFLQDRVSHMKQMIKKKSEIEKFENINVQFGLVPNITTELNKHKDELEMEIYDSYEKWQTKDIIRKKYWFNFIVIGFASAYAKIWREISNFDKYLATENQLS
jgi:hypothetical protein